MMSEIPYMLESTPEEFKRVRDLVWPMPTLATPCDVNNHTFCTVSDCECPCHGE